jgi:hypothetical protein
MHSNTRKLRTKPWIFYWSYYTLFRGSNISNPIFFYWLLKWRNYLSPYLTYNHVGTYFQCYGRSNEFIIFTLKELNWTYFSSHVVSKIPIVTPPWHHYLHRISVQPSGIGVSQWWLSPTFVDIEYESDIGKILLWSPTIATPRSYY